MGSIPTDSTIFMSKRTKLFTVDIADCKVDTFTVRGHGGAGKDTSNTGVRVTHEPSGSVGRSDKSRSQLDNKREAFVKMASDRLFRSWCRTKANQLLTGKSIDDTVEELMEAKNFRFEVRGEGGKWEIVSSEEGFEGA